MQCKLGKWSNIKVGSAELFQGQEKRVIIVSLVRASSLGFLSDKKVFNQKFHLFLLKIKA